VPKREGTLVQHVEDAGVVAGADFDFSPEPGEQIEAAGGEKNFGSPEGKCRLENGTGINGLCLRISGRLWAKGCMIA
jgi:hypothetical protein